MVEPTGAGRYYHTGAYLSQPLVLTDSYAETGGSTVALIRNYGWTQDGIGNAFTNEIVDYLDNWSIYKVTWQTVDIYGNLTFQQQYDWGAYPNGASRTYTMTYLTDSNYTNQYVRNRLLSATVSSPSGITTLASVSYDGTTFGALQDVPGLALHDNANYGTSFTYRGNPTTSYHLGDAGNTSYAYQISGIPYQMQHVNGPVVAVTTDASNSYSLPMVLTPNSNSSLATTFSYTSSFALTSVMGANGANQSVGYDNFNRPSGAMSVDGAVTGYTYSYNPNVQTATLGSEWKKTYLDGFGHVTSVQMGHDSTLVSTVDTQYAPCGCSPLLKMSQTSNPYGPSENEVWTTYTYDARGRVLTEMKPDGSVTHTTYSLNTTTVKDPAGKVKIFTNDGYGNLTQVFEPYPDPTVLTVGYATTYAYNGANQLVGVTMPRPSGNGTYSQMRSYSWNDTDLASSTDPETGTTTYQYDANHHMTQKTDANGQQTRNTYDPYGRLQQTQHWTWVATGQDPDPAHPVNTLQRIPSQDVDYYYDIPLDNSGYSTNTWGRLVGVQFHNEISPNDPFSLYYLYNYKPSGRVAGNRMEMFTSSGVKLVDMQASYTWDTQGKMTSMTYPLANPGDAPAGPTFNYSYDAMNRLSGMTETIWWQYNGTWMQANAPQAVVSGVTYNSASQMTQLTMGGWDTEQRSYNSLMQLTSIGGAGVNLFYNFTAGANNGRIASMTDNVTNETVTYQYDSLNRLIAASSTGGWNTSYGYDGWGNLTNKGGSQGVPYLQMGVDPSTNGSPGANGVPYSAPTSYNGGYFTPIPYDVEGRRITDQAGTWYTYDPWGRRVFQETPPTTSNPNYTCKVVFYAVTGKRIANFNCVYDVTVAPPVMTVAADGSAALLYQLRGTKQYFGGRLVQSDGNIMAVDRLGSVRGGGTGGAMAYYPYGEERTSTGNGQEKFGTYFRDPNGDDYAMARYYQSGSGRFATADPGGLRTARTGSPLTWNRLAYALGDPVNRTDPAGRESYNDGSGDGCYVDDDGTIVCNVTGISDSVGGEDVTCDDDPYQGQCSGIAATGIDAQKGATSAAYTSKYSAQGMAMAYAGLAQLTTGANLNSPQCQKDLAGLGAGITASAIEDIASTILNNNWLYDGVSSPTPMTVADFGIVGPGDVPSPNGTVGGFFQANPSLMGLSQKTGDAIWINSGWAYATGQSGASGGVLHEILHKLGTSASSQAAIDAFSTTALGHDCFN